jgi:hypothetical protein
MAMKVFISYAHADQAFVQVLDAELGKHGVDAWYDRKPGAGLQPGETWERRLASELNASAFVLVVLSPAATRVGAFVENEYQFALNQNACVIPLLYQDCSIPLALTKFQYTDFAHKHFADAFADLLSALKISPPATARAFAPNPFEDTARIDDAARFFNRANETNRIFDALARNQCVSIVGESKIGKSSLLFHVRQHGASKLAPTRFAFVNLEMCRDEKSFFECACEELGGAGNRDRDFKQRVGAGRVVLCLDEMERLNAKGYSDYVRSFLRGMAENANAPLKIVTASRQPLAQLFPDRAHQTSPFYNIFNEIIPLANFARADCEKLLDARLQNTGVSFDAATRDEMWTLTQGQPYKLQRAAHHLYEFARDPGYDWRARFNQDAMLA